MKNTLLPLQLFVRPEHDDPQPLILYHGRRCPDGYGAALAAWLFYGGQAEFRGLDHGEIKQADDLGELAGRAVYVLDFAFGPELLAEIEARAAKLVLLDHHKSAADELRGYRCQCGAVHFDMTRSGARLAWDFFFPDRPLPALIAHIEDRDLWRWALPGSAAFLAALDLEPRTFERWAQIAAFTPEQVAAFTARGQAMDEKYQKLCQTIAEGAEPLVFNGVPGLMVNAPGMFHSQVGDLLARRSGTFALMWQANATGVKAGLRSRSDFDCIPLAQSMGGGGHAQACGFRMPIARLPELLSGRFDAQAAPAPALAGSPPVPVPSA
jgi:oligoribonuclease NrnB/cAMP/cGMP phosphodiesterase (DHH superfamily)